MNRKITTRKKQKKQKKTSTYLTTNGAHRAVGRENLIIGERGTTLGGGTVAVITRVACRTLLDDLGVGGKPDVGTEGMVRNKYVTHQNKKIK